MSEAFSVMALAATGNWLATGANLLVSRSNFAIKRKDFGINPQAPEDKVSDTIHLTLSIAGASPR